MIIIMAAGKGDRWNNYLGVPKQLVPVNGEPILHRLFRLLGNRKYVITVPEKGYFGKVPCEEYVGSSETEIDKFINGEHLFNDKAIFLYGDVFWTKPALKRVLKFKNRNKFFGRTEKPKVLGKRASREIFALKITRDRFDTLKHFKQAFLDGDVENCGTWTYYHWLGDPGIVNINSWTTDFDLPIQYDDFIKKYNKRFYGK